MLARVLGLYEPEKYRALEAVLRPGMTFVDVGACKGDFALFAASKVGPFGRVVAVEPEPVNAQCLRKSIQRRGMPNVEVHEVALSDQSGSGTLHRADITAGVAVSSGWHSLTTGVPTRRDAVDIQTQTLDDLLVDLGIHAIDVLKIDVEGWEAAVLHGAAKTLSSGGAAPIVLMDLHPHLGVDPRAIAEILGGHGYQMFCVASPRDRLDVQSDTLEIVARQK